MEIDINVSTCILPGSVDFPYSLDIAQFIIGITILIAD